MGRAARWGTVVAAALIARAAAGSPGAGAEAAPRAAAAPAPPEPAPYDPTLDPTLPEPPPAAVPARRVPAKAAPAKAAPAKAAPAKAAPAKAAPVRPAPAAAARTPAAAAAAPAAEGRTAEEIAARLAKERAVAAQLAERETSLLGRLAELERQIEVEGRALRAAQARLRVSTQRLSVAEQKARAAEGEVASATEALGPRLTARYRMGREGYLRFLLGARSIAEVLRRKRLYTALLEADFASLGELRFKALGARAARDDLAAARDELAQSASAEQEKRTALEVRVSVQRRTLASVQQEKASHDQAVRELEEAARALEARIKELHAKGGAAAPATGSAAPAAGSPPAPGPSAGGTVVASLGARPLEPLIKSVRGKLLFPVEVGRIEARFGRAVDPRFGTVTLQRGVDIRSPDGTTVHAVHGGKVVHSGWFRGYGNLVILDHGAGYFSLYAHLANLDRAVGDDVSRGDPLGTVGDTGSLKGSYLYFELRDGQKPLDPERWLGRTRKPGPLVVKK